VRYADTVDPRTGMSVNPGLVSVTVVHASCMAADAWSTALAVLGPKDGLAMAERMNLAARFLLRSESGLHERLSSAMRSMLSA
jgi:thiamine biosynthesis lipoprotein